MAFETAVFTDVTRTTSVDGVAGFNFQALSEGIDAKDQETIRELMLHQVSNRWPSSAGETNHPPTSAYSNVEGRYYFARGRSTGQTHSGRRGNQLTEAAVTYDINDILPNRPAQLHGSVDWRVEAADEKTAQRWFAPLELKPEFESYALLEWLTGDAWMQEALPAFLTMLEQTMEPQAQKVIVIHEDIDTVLRWFALGTLLLDEHTAFALEYRAFVSDPFRSRAQLVGMHPALQEGPATGAHTIDLIKREISPIEISETARLVTKWVTELDTYEALDVIGLARRWMPIMGAELGSAGAEMIAGTWTAAIGREEWNLSIGIIERLAEGGYKEDLDLYMDELADAVSAYQLTGPEDFERSARASRFAAKTGRDDLVQAIIPPTLESLAAEPQSATAWVAELNADGPWKWPQSLDRQQLAQALTEVSLNAPVEAMPGLLTAAKPLSEEMPLERFKPIFATMSQHVLQHPQLLSELHTWYGTEPIQSLVRRQLLQDVQTEQESEATMKSLASGVWDSLCDSEGQSYYTDALQLLFLIDAAKLRSRPINERVELLRNKQYSVDKQHWQYILSDARLPDHIALYCAWIENIGLVPELQNRLDEQLQAVHAQEPTQAKLAEVERWMPLAECLDKHDKTPQQLPGQTRADKLHRFIDQIPTATERIKRGANRLAGIFGKGINK